MHELLNACNMTFFVLYYANSARDVFGNNTLNTFKGIRLSSLPALTWYSNTVVYFVSFFLFWLMLFFLVFLL